MSLVELNSVCKIKNGYAFKSEDYKTEGTPLLRISNFEDGEVLIDNKSIFVDINYLINKSDFIVEKGDILIALSGATTGKFGIYNYDFPSLLNQRIGLLKSGVSKKMESRYFFYYLSILKKEILRKAGGAAQPNISTKTIGELKIPLPPLPTQQKIAAILDEADKVRQLSKQLIEKYDALSQSLFLDMFGDPVTNPMGWEKKVFELLVHKQCPLSYGIVQPGDEFENGIPCVRPVDLTNQYISVGLLKKIDPKISSKFKRTILQGHEILLSVRGSVGVISIADNSLKGSNVTRGIVPIWFDSSVSNSLFFYYLYKTKRVQSEIKELSRGATLIQLNLKELRELKMITPPITFQNEFSERIKVIELQKAQAQESLQRSEELFQSLLQSAFQPADRHGKGELVS